jgi:hypothetical protein
MHGLRSFSILAALLIGLTTQALAIEPNGSPTRAQDSAPQATERTGSTRPPSAAPRSSSNGTAPSPARAAEAPEAGLWLLDWTAESALFADQTNITRSSNGQTRRMWTTWVYKVWVAGRAYENSLWEYDCGGRRLRALQSASYSATGTVLQTHAFESDFDFVVPGSIGEVALQHACQPFSNWRQTATAVPAGYDAMRFAADVAFFDTTLVAPHSCEPKMRRDLALGGDYSWAIDRYHQCIGK